MPRLIKTFSDTSILEYDQGAFDNWCVYLTRPNIVRYAPRDIQYFGRLQQLGVTHSNERIYQNYTQLYDRTTATLDPATMGFITDITSHYGSDALEMDILFTIIYAGMVAEENKEFTKLGKRVKRLGMHQALIERLDANVAANFSRGKKWRELDAIMRQSGF